MIRIDGRTIMKRVLIAIAAAAAVVVGGVSTQHQSAAAATSYTQAEATTNVYARNAPSTSASTVYLYQGGQIVYVYCWTTGTDINGDSVWYRTKPNPSGSITGYTAGYYLTTGADPKPGVTHC